MTDIMSQGVISMYSGKAAAPDDVIEETAQFRAEVARFLGGETPAISFRALRVPLGIYEQREDDTFVVRVRGADGVFLPQQARRVSELSELYGNGVVRLTTNQDLQIHRVPTEHTQAVRAGLLDVSLTSRVAGNKSIQNISSCPKAGTCPDQIFDVAPYAFALSEYLRDREINSPREAFRIAFSGCAGDCGLASVADLGFFASEADGVPGFRVYAAGSMGAPAATGILVDDFVPVDRLFDVADAMQRLCDEHAGSGNLSPARLRRTLNLVGPDEFRRLYRSYLDKTKLIKIDSPAVRPVGGPASITAEASDPEYQRWKKRRVRAQDQAGMNTVLIAFAAGDVSAHMLAAIAEMAERIGTVLRATKEQDILIPNVPTSDLELVHSALKSVCEAFVTGPSAVPVPCAGATTCKLGLCLSRVPDHTKEATQVGAPPAFEATIRLSATKAAGGDRLVAPIKLLGTSRQVNGRHVPFYTVVVDRNLDAESEASGITLGRVPAHSVPAFLYEFWAAAEINHRDGEKLEDWLDRWAIHALQSLTVKHAYVPSFDEAPDFYQAFDPDTAFVT